MILKCEMEGTVDDSHNDPDGAPIKAWIPCTIRTEDVSMSHPYGENLMGQEAWIVTFIHGDSIVLNVDPLLIENLDLSGLTKANDTDNASN